MRLRARRDERAPPSSTTIPAAQARHFAAAGFDWLHVVDLDGAFAGKPVNGAAVEAILAPSICRSSSAAASAIVGAIEPGSTPASPASILGTVALRDPDAGARSLPADYPGRIAVGIDARGGKVAVEGWAETSEIAAARSRPALRGCRRRRDHLHRHRPRRAAGRRQCRGDRRSRRGSSSMPVIASGGVASLDESRRCKAHARRRHRRRDLRPRAL